MSGRPRLLDLFCKAGGAGMGYHRAGFDVTGVDIEPQPRYPFAFVQGDALEYVRAHGHKYDAIHASPPCQKYTAMGTMWNARNDHPDLVDATRALLQALRVPYVIENVPGAPMPAAIVLCGSSFDLGVGKYQLRRHRYFESSVFMLAPSCRHRGAVIGIYGDHARQRKRNRATGERGIDFPDRDKLRLAGTAMGIDWMNWKELSQAIPPAYTEWIGRHLMTALVPEEVCDAS